MLLSTTAVSWSDMPLVWSFILQIGILLIAMLVGNLIRLRVPFVKKLLLPTSLIAGVMLFLVKTVLQLCGVDTDALLNNALMQVITYHALGIGFAAMALKRAPARDRKANMTKVFDTALINGGSYMLQSTLGLLITLVCFGGIYYAGIILPLGFGQGPGNAMIWGANYEVYGLTGGASFGLTVATVGFVVASVVGVVYMNIMRRRGKLTVRYAERTADVIEGSSAPESESVDKLTVNLGLVFLAYGFCFLFMWALSATGIGLLDSLGWGLNFMWAMFFAYLLKWALGFMGKKAKVQPREEYRSNYLLDRISGFCFDLMIVAGVAAIEWEHVARYWAPLLALCVAGSAGTFLFIYLGSKHAFSGYEHETFLGNFGTLTGTVSNGMILVREVDPEFRTPAAGNLVACNFFTVILNAPLFLLLATVPTGLFGLEGKASAWVCFGIFAALFCLYATLLFRRAIFRKRYPKGKELVWTEETDYITKDELDARSAASQDTEGDSEQ